MTKAKFGQAEGVLVLGPEVAIDWAVDGQVEIAGDNFGLGKSAQPPGKSLRFQLIIDNLMEILRPDKSL